MKIKLAELIIDVGDAGEFTQNMCGDYAVDGDSVADITIKLKADAVKKEQELYPTAEVDYLENICIYREICREMVRFDAMLIHSAAIAVDGKAYLFSAKSGTGKTTHINLWLKKFGDRAVIINGDKPLIREIDGVLKVFGTPWCGKEGINQNTSAPIEGICILNRGEENKIEQISKIDALAELMGQTIRPEEGGAMMKLLDVLDKVIMNIPVYRLHCNMDIEAAEVAYSGMCRE